MVDRVLNMSLHRYDKNWIKKSYFKETFSHIIGFYDKSRREISSTALSQIFEIRCINFFLKGLFRR